MWITAYFQDAGVPKTGLTPSLDAYVVSTSLQAITGATMTEIGGGFYKYEFTTADSSLNYLFIADGGAALAGSERYAIGESALDEMDTKIQAIYEGVGTGDSPVSSSDTIKQKLDTQYMAYRDARRKWLRKHDTI